MHFVLCLTSDMHDLSLLVAYTAEVTEAYSFASAGHEQMYTARTGRKMGRNVYMYVPA